MVLPVVSWVNTASTFAFVVLAIFVLLARRKGIANIAFAVYALSFAAGVAIHNVGSAILGETALRLQTENALGVVTSLALIVLALRLPTPATRRDAPWALAAVAIALVIYAIEPSDFSRYRAVTWGAAIFISLRWRSYATQDERTGAALVSVGIALFLALSHGTQVIGRTQFELSWAAKFVMPFLLAALWLWNGARGGGRPAFLVAWVTLAAALAGMVERTAFPVAPDLYGNTLTRLTSVALLSYAIVRHQMLGADVKARWAISKSTIAAVFIAVFFIASEAAQQFFGDTLGSTYVGIAAAGALVFALAPLQRAAERLAEKAVPTQGAIAPTRPEAQRREEVFMKAARLALRGGLSRDEEVHLAELAEELGIGAGRAATLLRAVERERAGVA